MLQAQIGGNDYQEFVRNNIDSTRLVLDANLGQQCAVPGAYQFLSRLSRLADDYYTNTRRIRKKMVLESDPLPGVAHGP
jgi:hypothetical protein